MYFFMLLYEYCTWLATLCLQAIVRFEALNGAQAALTAKSVDGKLTVNGQEVVTRILEGE